jgi:hypothetical protein
MAMQKLFKQGFFRNFGLWKNIFGFKGTSGLPAAFLLLPILIFSGAGAAYTQQRYPTGAILDKAAYNALPRKAPLATRAYEGLPEMVSLKRYAPLPGDQTEYGTCVAWASAYAARTISESIALNRNSQTETTRNVFSPVYIYRNIRPDDPECQRGAQIHWALDLMKDSGAVRMLEIERSVDFPRVDLSYYQESRRYPIADYVTLFSRDENSKTNLIVRTVKKSLVEGKPVIIGMNTPFSFMEAEGAWRPSESPDNYYGGHAMCVVGYDDNREGGAFEILNSWGRKWGNGGFIWIPYRAFQDFVMEGYEMIENLATYSDTVKFAGFARIEIEEAGSSSPAPLVFFPGAESPDPADTTAGFFKTAAPLRQGTEFRFVLGAAESAYVYAFAASQPQTGAEDHAGAAFSGAVYSPVQLFPQPGVSPLLNYSDSAVALPGEDKTLVLDNVPGMEYLVVLYAKQSLNILDIMRRFEKAEGTVNARLSAVIGENLLSVNTAADTGREAAFTAESSDAKTVAALVVAIDHR